MGKRKKQKQIEDNEIDDSIEQCDNDDKIDDDSDDDLFSKSDDLPSLKNDVAIDPTLISDAELHHLIPKLRRINDNDKELLRQHNLSVQNGRFTSSENKILSKNWQRYLDDYNVPNKSLLLGHFQYERSNNDSQKIKKLYRKFANETQLWLRLAKNLPNRTIFQIYCRARFLLSNLKKAKDFTDEDRQIILKLYRKYGDHFTTFCEEYGYNPKCAREILRHTIKSNGVKLNHGEWSEKEVKKLKKIVSRLMKKLALQSYDGIPWSHVSKKLHRSDVQCRQKFFSKSIFCQMITHPPIDDWNEKLDIAKFIALLKHLNFDDFNMIDWDYIKEKFSSIYFNILLRKWREIRVRIPDHQHLSLSEILDHLYKTRVLKHFGHDQEKMKEIEDFINTT